MAMIVGEFVWLVVCVLAAFFVPGTNLGGLLLLCLGFAGLWGVLTFDSLLTLPEEIRGLVTPIGT